MRLLLCHRAFPGQFRWLLDEFNRVGIDVVFICKEKNNWSIPDNCRVIQTDQIKHSLGHFYNSIGEEFSSEFIKVSLFLKSQGWTPDCILAHSGWGAWRACNVFPSSRLIIYAEWWYTEVNLKYMGFTDMNEYHEINAATKNAILASDFTLTPTEWQKHQFPINLKSKINVIEDGFPDSLFNYNNTVGNRKSEKLELIFAARSLEYSRGIDRLLYLINFADKNDLKCNFTIIADNRRVYDSKEAYSSMQSVIKEIKEHPMVTFDKQKGYTDYVNSLKSADIHLYLSRPFVLSWSFIESMLCGSFVFTIDNPASLEKTGISHINFPNIDKCCETVALYSQAEMRDKLRNRKAQRFQNGPVEYEINYRSRHSLQGMAHRLYSMFINSL